MRITTLAAIGISSTLLFSACINKTPEETITDNIDMETKEVMIEENTMMEDNSHTDDTNDGAMEKTMDNVNQYMDYSETAIASVIADGKTPILFFHADWCPTCKVADQDITENISDIPENVVIIKTDYDDSSELKKKYLVTTQHTFVQLDKDANSITKWSGGGVQDIIDYME